MALAKTTRSGPTEVARNPLKQRPATGGGDEDDYDLTHGVPDNGADTVIEMPPISLEPSLATEGGPKDDRDLTLPSVHVVPNKQDDLVIKMPTWRECIQQGIDKVFQAEVSHWQTKYEKDLEFRTKIDEYAKFRVEVMKLKDEGHPMEQLMELYRQLGTMLADAFGMLDPQTGDWSEEVKRAANAGGAEYGRPSTQLFAVTQLPVMGKAFINLGAELFATPTQAKAIEHLTNLFYPFIQMPLAIWAAQKNGELQSPAVQAQKRENPTWCPNVVSSKLVNEDGTPGKLRSLPDVHQDLNELTELKALIEGTAHVNELEQELKKITGKVMLASAKLQQHLLDVTLALGSLQKRGKSAPLNAIEKRILDDRLPWKTRVEALLSITGGRAALSPPEVQHAKRLLQQLDNWEMLQDALEVAVNSEGFIEPREVSQKLKAALVKTEFEYLLSFNYRMLNVVSNQATVRHWRTAFFMSETLAGLTGRIVHDITGSDKATLASHGLQGCLSAAQAIAYASMYPKAIGKDTLNKFATQWGIVAMSGSGNFLGKDGKVDPKKLDKAVTGPVQTRLSTFASLLDHDKSVYLQALFGWIVDRATLDNDEAVSVSIVVPGSGERRDIACTYATLSDEFLKLKTSVERQRFIDRILEKLPAIDSKQGKKIQRNLQLYEAHEVNIANKGNVAALLDERTSTLPVDTQEMLRSALDYTHPFAVKEALERLDRKLFELAGKIEQRGELPGQAAQKLGQAFAWLLLGTGGFLLLKSIFTLGVEAAMLYGDLSETAAEELATDILAGKITGDLIALASNIFSLGLNESYHEYIARKNLQRQNAAGGPSIVNAPAPSLKRELWENFLEFLRVDDATVREVTGYETLVSTPIPQEDWPPRLKFIPKSRLTDAMKEQMFAADMRSWFQYFDEKHGMLAAEADPAALRAAIRKNIDDIKNGTRGNKPPEPPPVHAEASEGGVDAAKRIEVSAPVKNLKVPPLKLPSTLNVRNKLGAISSQTPRSQRDNPPPLSHRDNPLTPRLDANANLQDQKLNPPSQQKKNPLYTGQSTVHIPKIKTDPGEVEHIKIAVTDKDKDNAESEDSAELPVPAPAIRQSPLMATLPWEDSGMGFHFAKTAQVTYLCRDPARDAFPLQAYSIPDAESRDPLHIADRKYPSLAVMNMLRMDLAGNGGGETLTSEDEIARFFLHHIAQVQPERAAAMPFQDLALYTQQQTLRRGRDMWRPMTTSTVRFVPDAEETIQPLEGAPPALAPKQSFGISYTATDYRGVEIQSSVLFHWAGGMEVYTVLDPTSARPLETAHDDPNDALRWYLDKTTSMHPDLASGMTFTVLHHVPPRTSDSNGAIRDMIANAGGSPETLTWDWMDSKRNDIASTMKAMADAAQDLEAENSHLLSLGGAEVMDLHQRNAECIAILGDAYAKLATMAVDDAPPPLLRRGDRRSELLVEPVAADDAPPPLLRRGESIPKLFED